MQVFCGDIHGLFRAARFSASPRAGAKPPCALVRMRDADGPHADETVVSPVVPWPSAHVCYTRGTRCFAASTLHAPPADRDGKDAMNRIVRYLMLTGAWIACALGCIGVFVPVLPTTPLLLLATFLFAKSSPRCHAWIVSTKVYKTYVAAFKEAGGIPSATKVRILTVSFAVMGASALIVREPVVWVVLGCVAVFLIYLMCVRIPTIPLDRVQAVRQAEEAE